MTYEINFKHEIGDMVYIVKRNHPLMRGCVRVLIYEQTAGGEVTYYEVQPDNGTMYIRISETEIINAANTDEALAAILKLANTL